MHGEIHWADLNPTVGREQSGHCPVLVISNDIENQMDIVTVIPITSRKEGRRIYPNEVLITLQDKEAIILCHQVRTLPKHAWEALGSDLMEKVTEVLCRRFT